MILKNGSRNFQQVTEVVRRIQKVPESSEKN